MVAIANCPSLLRRLRCKYPSRHRRKVRLAYLKPHVRISKLQAQCTPTKGSWISFARQFIGARGILKPYLVVETHKLRSRDDFHSARNVATKYVAHSEG